MKKLISILLCLALLLVCTAALAETATAEKTEIKVNDGLTLRAVVPDGYAITDLSNENGYLYLFESVDDTPLLLLSLGVDDEWPAGTKLNNLSDEDLKEIERTRFLTDLTDTEITYTETAYGTKLLVAIESDKTLATFYTLYEGYEIEFNLIMKNGTALAQEQIDSCVKFLSDLDLVFAEK